VENVADGWNYKNAIRMPGRPVDVNAAQDSNGYGRTRVGSARIREKGNCGSALRTQEEALRGLDNLRVLYLAFTKISDDG